MKKLTIILLLTITLSSILYQNSSAQWVRRNGISATLYVNSVTYGPSPWSWAGTDSGIYRSNDGDNYTRVSPTNLRVSSLIQSGINVCAGVFPEGGIWLSTDNGLTWNFKYSGLTVYSLAASGNNIFAGVGDLGSLNGVWKSTNNGQNWTHITTLNNSSVHSLVINGNTIFAGVSSYDYSVYLSTNNGLNWILDSAGIVDRSVYSLAFSGNTIYAGTVTLTTPRGIYRQTNYGSNWTQTTLNNQNVHSLAISGNNIFAGTDSGFYVSNNNGSTWTKKNEGFPNNTVVLSIYVYNNYSIFVGTNRGEFARLYGEVCTQPISEQVPENYALEQNYPNPFNPSTKIKYQIAKSSDVHLIIYDILGKEVSALVNEKLSAGTYEAEWNGAIYPSGVYFYKLVASDPETSSGLNFTETKKLILLK